MGFRKPSKVQERALPLLMANPAQNFVGQSQSGTGKTAAFVLNVLSRLDLSPDMQVKPQAEANPYATSMHDPAHPQNWPLVKKLYTSSASFFFTFVL